MTTNKSSNAMTRQEKLKFLSDLWGVPANEVIRALFAEDTDLSVAFDDARRKLRALGLVE